MTQYIEMIDVGDKFGFSTIGSPCRKPCIEKPGCLQTKTKCINKRKIAGDTPYTVAELR